MRGKSPVLVRLVKVSAAVLGVGLVVTACSPVKMGAAAVVGSQRITMASLDTEVTNLSQAAKLYPGVVQLSAAQETQKALAQIYASAKASAQAQGVSNVTLNLILVANGIPPDMSAELGRYQAIETQYIEQLNGGKIPTAAAAQTATTAKLQRAQCVAAKSLQIQINPQFGRLNYTQYQIVSVPGTLSRAGGPAKAAPSGLTPAC